MTLSQARRLWVLIAIYAGARRSEIEALRWEQHVDLDQGWLLIPGTKTKKSRRMVPITESLSDALTKEWEPSGVVVAPWLNARRDLIAACQRVCIRPVTPNDLRRTFASWLKQRGVDSMVVARLMGKSPAMVERVYGYLNDQSLTGAIKILPRLEEIDPIPVTESGASLRLGPLTKAE
jgi:integrase